MADLSSDEKLPAVEPLPNEVPRVVGFENGQFRVSGSKKYAALAKIGCFTRVAQATLR